MNSMSAATTRDAEESHEHVVPLASSVQTGIMQSPSNFNARRRSSSLSDAGFGEAEEDRFLSEEEARASAKLSSRLPAPLSMFFSKAVLACLLYSACSIGMTLINKLILTSYGFPYHMALLLYQNAVSVLLLQGARCMGLVDFANLNRSQIIAWIPLDFLFVGMLLTSFLSLGLLSVPMATIFKNTTNILVTAGDYFFYGREVSRPIVGSLLIMLFGAIMAGRSDLEFDPWGYFWAGANCCITAAYVLYMPRAMSDSKLNAFGRVYYNNLLSLPLIVGMDLFSSNDLGKILTTEITMMTSIDFGFVLCMVTSGCIGFFLSLSSFHCVQLTSPTTYAMVGAMNKIPLAVMGVIIFQTRLSASSTTFIFVSLIAGAMYAYAKSREVKPKAEDSKPKLASPGPPSAAPRKVF
ncbi:GDP-mannose transporter [Hondaea fermentalgiana]|uniref:GDP-mannose transporter n=1 Tax=Hondaea fermentalgiana TaxID=2315210 RepID=A0A2R5GGC5_9STRA|nr:GDP-mannose transporter [Hondaea fermentalgiana]|eukprot:GBG29937.1 GDP-mannose transporter [Hondaea fermentalgiana]